MRPAVHMNRDRGLGRRFGSHDPRSAAFSRYSNLGLDNLAYETDEPLQKFPRLVLTRDLLPDIEERLALFSGKTSAAGAGIIGGNNPMKSAVR